MIKKKYVLSAIIVITQSIFLIFKSKLGAFTPDEMLYTTGEYVRGSIVYNELALRFYITYRVISFLYNLNEYLFPVIQIILSLILYLYLYKVNKIHKIIKQSILLLFFLLPSALYFSSAYLRDYIVYLLAILLLFQYKISGLKFYTLVIFLLFSILRTEAGIIVLIAYLLVNINNRYHTTFVKINHKSIYYILPSLVFFLFLFININFVWEYLYERFTNTYNDYYGFSIWHIDPTKNNIIFFSIFNWFAYYAPFLFKESYSLFSYFMMVDSIIIGFLFIRALFNIKGRIFEYDRLYQISYIILLGTFFISILDVMPETMYRHRMAYLPFLLYLNFASSK